MMISSSDSLCPPESQTLRLLSLEPVKIWEPSSENATEVILALWAMAFSVLSSSVAV